MILIYMFYMFYFLSNAWVLLLLVLSARVFSGVTLFKLIPHIRSNRKDSLFVAGVVIFISARPRRNLRGHQSWLINR